MEDSQSLEQQISCLRRKISTLEWDIPNLRNDDIRKAKESELRECKHRLDCLIKNR